MSEGLPFVGLDVFLGSVGGNHSLVLLVAHAVTVVSEGPLALTDVLALDFELAVHGPDDGLTPLLVANIIVAKISGGVVCVGSAGARNEATVLHELVLDPLGRRQLLVGRHLLLSPFVVL